MAPTPTDNSVLFNASWNSKVLAVGFLVLTVPIGTVLVATPDVTGTGRVLGGLAILAGIFFCTKFWRAKVVVEGTAVISKLLRTRVISLKEVETVALGRGGFAGWQTPILRLNSGKRVRLEQVADLPNWLPIKTHKAADLVGEISAAMTRIGS